MGFTNAVLNHTGAAWFTFLSTCALINAMNMLDGLGGLLSSVVLSQFIGLFVFAGLLHALNVMLQLSTEIGAISGFFLFSLPFLKSCNATVFIGDAGNSVLGFITVGTL